MFLNKKTKLSQIDSLDRVVNEDDGTREVSLGETIASEVDVFEECIEKSTYQFIRQLILTIPERDQKIIELYFGFIDNRPYTQKEISQMFSISQSYISRVIIKNIKRLKVLLIQEKIVELGKHNQAETMLLKKKSLKKLPQTF